MSGMIIPLFRRAFFAVNCAAMLLLAGAAIGAPTEPVNISWDSPSANHHGSMPLGNGDIAINAWMTADGDLQFYIAKTDAWDDNARLLKVGKVRVHFEPSIIEPKAFRQELKLREGCLEITSGSEKKSLVRVWVDAHDPVIHVTATTDRAVQATAFIELWRTNRAPVAELQVSDVMMNRKAAPGEVIQTIVEPDTLLRDLPESNRIGWYHHNIKSVGPQMMAEIQGLTSYKQADPLLHRTFGAIITADKGLRQSDTQLVSPPATSHRFSVFVSTRHPSTPDGWLADLDQTIRRVEKHSFPSRYRAHERWWNEFWDRSWIRALARTNAPGKIESIVPVNRHPVRLGEDQVGANRFAGELGRVSIFNQPLDAAGVGALFALERNRALPPAPGLLFTGTNLPPQTIAGSDSWDFTAGFTLEVWVRPDQFGGGGARLVDKTTPGVNNGFLLDTHPGNSLRLICGETILQLAGALPAGQWAHVVAVADSAAGACVLYLNGTPVAGGAGVAVRDLAGYVSQMYDLQRFITACAGRGAYPIKFNGSLFTVPPGPTEADPDYRRWGPGYWWQNTRLPYISLCTSGDFDLQEPLFRMYADELLPLCQYRTQHYLGHAGAFYPECIMFWGAIFSETYGWTPFEQRKDKLQESGWHKWEWVAGPELAWMMLDYYDHTLDRGFLQRRALPVAREVLTFFDRHYPTNAQGKLVMHPSQALETWWHCTNAMPELAGCRAVAERILALPAKQVPSGDRAFYAALLQKLPPIPLREVNGKKALAPAEFFADKRNIENPELYPVFPFRLFAFNRPNADWALTALEHRWDRGHSGWRQDDVFMAYMGLAEDARKAVVGRARTHDRGERFPAFWGPNYDWTPDQDHGGILMKAFQAMLLQTDGDRIFLLPAWPKDWDVEFKLHAPGKTVLEGRYQDGRMESLKVSPGSRRKDVTICP